MNDLFSARNKTALIMLAVGFGLVLLGALRPDVFARLKALGLAYGNVPQQYQDGGRFINFPHTSDMGQNLRRDWKISGAMQMPAKGIDGDRSTFAAVQFTGEARVLEIDLGAPQEIVKVIQDHGAFTMDFPDEYSIEVSPDGKDWQKIFSGKGAPAHSVAEFKPCAGRYLKITAKGAVGKRWVLSELGIY